MDLDGSIALTINCADKVQNPAPTRLVDFQEVRQNLKNIPETILCFVADETCTPN